MKELQLLQLLLSILTEIEEDSEIDEPIVING